MKKILIILGIVFWASQLWAATYFIDPTCSTSGDGTTATCGRHGPFKTWAEVSWAPGNTYSQRGGTTAYETITVGASGTAERAITINSHGTGKAILNGVFTISPREWTANDPVRGVYSKVGTGFVQIEDGIVLRSASSSSCSDYRSYYDRFVYPKKKYYRPATGTPADHTVQWVRDYGINLGTNDYITISGFKIKNFNYGIYGSASSGADSNSYLTITNNDLSDMTFGIWINFYNSISTDVKIINNTFDYIRMSFEAQSFGDCKGGTGNFDHYEISYNKMMNGNCVRGTDFTWEDVNTLDWDEEGIGFQALSNSSIHHNTISGKIRGIVLYTCAGLDTHNNNIFNNNIDVSREGIMLQPDETAPAAKAVYNNNFYYNVIKTGGYGYNAVIYAGNVPTPVGEYNRIYNNTFIISGNGLFFTKNADYFDVRNNIFYNGSNHQIHQEGPAIHNLYDYNLYKSGRAWTSFSANGKALNWIQWKALGNNHDKNSPPLADPLFVNAAGGDYTLTSSSPAKWRGVHVGLIRDYADNPAHNPSSLGAYEYNPPKRIQ